MPRHPVKSWTLHQWPAADRWAWNAARQHGDILAPGGAAAHWRDSTALTVVRSYGHWLRWLSENGLLDPHAGPAQQMTPENVGRLVSDLRQTLSMRTITGRISQVYMAAKVMVPEGDWAWLQEIWMRLERRTTPFRNKNARLVDSADLLHCGAQGMEEADRCTDRCLFERAVLYRDAFMVALLALRPFRLANFTAIEMGRHLVRRGGGYWIEFQAAETKTWTSLEAPFPEKLVPYLERYLTLYRPIFLRNPKRDPLQRDKLWLSTWGRGLCEDMVYQRIMKLTKERLGRAINPHAFRHAAATSIAFADPEHVQIIKTILGHGSLATSAEYYDLAQAAEASRRYNEHLDALRRG
ncbi:MAG: tyrosine-type recombinase/integrase [Alphaproteobacteria bacterium]